LAPEVPDVRVDEVVADGDDTARVTEEGTAPGNAVEDRVESQLGGLALGPPQALLHTPGATDAQGRHVRDTSPVTEVVKEAARRHDGVALGERRVIEGEVLER